MKDVVNERCIRCLNHTCLVLFRCSQTVTKCNRLKMVAEDGRSRFTDTADAETLLRLIQSVPSSKAEPIKLWLAKVGYERMQEMSDPAKSLGGH